MSTTMGLVLQPGVSLAAIPAGPVLRRRGVDVDHPLSVRDAVALTLLDATGDAARAGSMLDACVPNAGGIAQVRAAIHRYWPFLCQGEPRPNASLDWLRDVGAAPASLRLPAARSAAPRSINWLVTLACHRRCPYCFYRVLPHAADFPETPRDASLSFQRASAMLDEMGRLGTADLYLTGGEPLLRRDLPELIAHAARSRVRTHLVTKYPIEAPLARRLSEAGLTQVTVSLDDARPREAGALAGAKDHHAQATAAIRALCDEGLDVAVNCVVTGVNEGHLAELATQVIALGVTRLKLGRLSPPASRGQTLLRLRPRGPDLATHLGRLREQFADQIVIEGSSAAESGSASGERCGADLVCEVGMTALDVLPDGRVTRCRYLPGEERLVVGSVARQSLQEIWESSALRDKVSPGPEAYAGSACAGCSGFEKCNARGRCYFTALQSSGQLHAPDAYCAR